MNEAALLGFAKADKYEETIAALSAHVRHADRDGRPSDHRRSPDPVLILGKAIGLEWATVRALLPLRLGPSRAPSRPDIESFRVNFERLLPSTAQRVMNFWKTRRTSDTRSTADTRTIDVVRTAALATISKIR